METASAARLLPVVVATSSPRARVCAAAALRRTRDAPGATAQPSLPPARQRVVHSGLSATTRRRCVTVHAAVAPASPAGRQARVGSVSNPLVAADSMPWRGPYQPVVSPALLVAAFWKFLRPHTIRGTVLGTSAVVFRALSENPGAIDFSLVPRAILGLVALLCGNGYIVGINQIYDISIDKINKPFLPVASGEMSLKFAWIAVIALAVGGGAIVASNFGSLIIGLYAFGLLLGTVYSVPPLRLKRFPLPAFMIIATVRGFLLNFGVYHATRAALGLPFVWSPAIAFITCFVTMFATVIAITKDLPDVEGDRQHDIQTFATQMGVRNIALLAIMLLLGSYGTAAALAFTQPHIFNTPIMAGGHLALASALVVHTLGLERAKYNPDAIQGFYRFIWSLFYSEYVLFLFI